MTVRLQLYMEGIRVAPGYLVGYVLISTGMDPTQKDARTFAVLLVGLLRKMRLEEGNAVISLFNGSV